jgi:transcriptional regulator with XRE-family HTH domain
MGLIANRLKTQRIKVGLKQADLAELVKISVPTITRLENGRSDPKTEELSRLASALNTSVAYLLGETDFPGRPDGLLGSLLGMDNPSPPSTTIITPEGAIRQITDELLAKSKLREIKSDLAPLNPHHRTVVRVLPKDFAACCGDGIDWGTGTVEFEYEYIDPDPDLTRFSPVIAMSVVGGSMEPDIEEGDMVLFTENSDDIEYASNGSIAVVNYDGRMIVRGLFKRNDRVVLKAWNKDYDDIELTPDDEFRVCGIVLRVDKSKRPRSML